MTSLTFYSGGLPFVTPPGRDAAVPLPWAARSFKIPVRTAAQAVRRNPEIFDDGCRYKIRSQELSSIVRLQNEASLPLPPGGNIMMLTLKGVLGLAFVTNNSMAFRMCLRLVDVLSRLTATNDDSSSLEDISPTCHGEKSQSAIFNPSPRLLEHKPAQSSPKPRKPAKPRLTCTPEPDRIDAVQAFADQHGATKANAMLALIETGLEHPDEAATKLKEKREVAHG